MTNGLRYDSFLPLSPFHDHIGIGQTRTGQAHGAAHPALADIDRRAWPTNARAEPTLADIQPYTWQQADGLAEPKTHNTSLFVPTI